MKTGDIITDTMKTFLLLLLSLNCFAQIKVSTLPVAENIDNSWVTIVQDGINKKVSANLFVKKDTILVVKYIVVIDHQYTNSPYTITWDHKPMKIDTVRSIPLLKGKKVEIYDITGTVVNDGKQGRHVKQ